MTCILETCTTIMFRNLYIGTMYNHGTHHFKAWILSGDIGAHCWRVLLTFTPSRNLMCVQFFSNQHLLVSSSNLLFEFCDLDCCMFFIYCGSVLLNNLSRHYSRHQAHLSQLRGRNTIYALFTLCSRNQNDLNICVCIFSTPTNFC